MLKKIFIFILLSVSIDAYSWSFFGFGEDSNKDQETQKPFTIMIDPAGDSKNSGRSIDEEFEQALTLQFAKSLKESIETDNKNIRIIITRYQSEVVEELQNASFANRLSPDLYLNLNFYKETSNHNNIYLYYFINNPVTDLWIKQDNSLKLYPFDQAYKINLNKTINFCTKLFEILKLLESKYTIRTNKPIGIPLKQLAGITSPAITIEAGIKNSKNLNNLVDPIKSMILEFVNNITQENHDE